MNKRSKHNRMGQVALLSAAFAGGALAADNVTIKVYNASTPSPAFIVKRGQDSTGPQWNNAKKDTINFLKNNGYKCYTLVANLDAGTFKDTFKNVNGTLKHYPHTQYDDFRKYVVDSGLEMLAQVQGNPNEFAARADRSGDMVDYQPLPEDNQFDSYANLVGNWMKTAHGVAACTWLGQQETEHTVGFTGNNKEKTQAKKHANVKLYAKLWNKVETKLSGKTGALQMNAGGRGNGTYDVAWDNSTRPDYFTIQNYQGENTTKIVDAADSAMNSDDKPIYFNRYGYNKNNNGTNHNTSEGMIRYLKAEKQVADKANKITGYCIKSSNVTKNRDWLGKVGQFLNQMPNTRRDIGLSGSGLGGFATSNSSKGTVIIWNTSGTTKNITINMVDAPSGWSKVSVQKGAGSIFNTSASWNNTKDQVTGLTLANQEFAMVKVYQ